MIQSFGDTTDVVEGYGTVLGRWEGLKHLSWFFWGGGGYNRGTQKGGKGKREKKARGNSKNWEMWRFLWVGG